MPKSLKDPSLKIPYRDISVQSLYFCLSTILSINDLQQRTVI